MYLVPALDFTSFLLTRKNSDNSFYIFVCHLEVAPSERFGGRSVFYNFWKGTSFSQDVQEDSLSLPIALCLCLSIAGAFIWRLGWPSKISKLGKGGRSGESVEVVILE